MASLLTELSSTDTNMYKKHAHVYVDAQKSGYSTRTNVINYQSVLPNSSSL